jgi:hypothetical protein
LYSIDKLNSYGLLAVKIYNNYLNSYSL